MSSFQAISRWHLAKTNSGGAGRQAQCIGPGRVDLQVRVSFEKDLSRLKPAVHLSPPEGAQAVMQRSPSAEALGYLGASRFARLRSSMGNSVASASSRHHSQKPRKLTTIKVLNVCDG
jgi:hypothetical protein